MTEKFANIIAHFQKELLGLQVGRVTPAVLDDVLVEAYGTKTALSQLSTITSQGATQLVIQPWDKSILKDVERALRMCGRDYNPTVDGAVVRLPFPPLTEEKRKEIVKLVSDRAEAAKVHIKLLREECMNDIKTKKVDKAMSEDQAFAEQKNIQKLVDQYNKEVTTLADKKAADVMTL
ncbi:MAG: ribosome recycling factor [Patescibacteria group bacterium]|jgi:ribosome recycling factor